MIDILPTIKAAAVQAEPVVLDREATVAKACQLIAESAANGAQLIIFPEMFIPTYINSAVWGRGLSSFGTANAKRAWSRLWQNSVEIPSHTTDRLSKTARDANAVVAIGLHERESKSRSLYNTLLFLNSDGTLLGKHRKLMPTNHERMVHGRGDGSTLRVYDTPVGRVGGLICWENWMPLSRFALYSQGEQIHIAPTADDDERTLINTRNTAIEGGVFVISVCMVLRKESFPKDFEFQQELEDAGDYLQTGGSAIIGPDGSILAGPLWKEEGILYAELDLNQVVEQSQLLDVAGHYARPDVLSLHLKATPQNVLEKPAKHT
ncbi:MAG: carbon-nitrogen hydrolase family protein [Desulfobacterales bacterium]|nr:carbon-nitrogen hydrolase family protein [Desulfobacterales bacterium]